MQSEQLQPPNTENTPSGGYVLLRRIFFIVCIAVFFLVLLYLVYHNGESIYANGI